MSNCSKFKLTIKASFLFRLNTKTLYTKTKNKVKKLNLAIINQKEIMKKKQKKHRGWFFTQFKKVLKLFIKKPKMVFLGSLPKRNTIILSNHVGTTAPLKLELYFPHKIRFWGTHEMNEGLGSVYKYLSNIFYHQKKGWPLWLAKFFCLLAAPLSFLFYRGLNLIPTYKDVRLKKTLKESLETLKQKTNIVIFPEDSKNGYLDTLQHFFAGFVILMQVAQKEHINLNVIVSYLNKKNNTYIFDKPISATTLFEKHTTRKAIASALKNRCNQLGEMTRNQKN